MKRFFSILPLMLAVMFTLAACAAPSSSTQVPPVSSAAVSSTPASSADASSSSAASAAVTFTDALGRTVTVEQPQRVAAVMGSFADTWQLAGGALIAVTEDAYGERDLALPETTLDLGSMLTPSLEAILAAEPDFLLLSSKISGHVALREPLEAAGVNAAYFEVETFAHYLDMLKTCTAITGRDDLYETNGAAVQARIDAAIARAEGQPSPTVLFIRAFSTGSNAKGSDNMTGAILKDLGCQNIADSDQSLLENLSMEAIIEADPDFIFVTTMGASSQKALDKLKESYQQNPAWKDLTAVKTDRYHLLPKDLFHTKPNARWAESYEMLADLLYGQA